jgi:hypothetical protein
MGHRLSLGGMCTAMVAGLQNCLSALTDQQAVHACAGKAGNAAG